MSSFTLMCGRINFFEQPICLEQLSRMLFGDKNDIQGPLLLTLSKYNATVDK